MFSIDSEASASESIENIEEMFPRYYKFCDVWSRVNYQNTLESATRMKRVKTELHEWMMAADVIMTFNVSKYL